MIKSHSFPATSTSLPKTPMKALQIQQGSKQDDRLGVENNKANMPMVTVYPRPWRLFLEI